MKETGQFGLLTRNEWASISRIEESLVVLASSIVESFFMLMI